MKNKSFSINEIKSLFLVWIFCLAAPVTLSFSCWNGIDDMEETIDKGKIKEYSLRDRGPAGGWIFYINPNAAADGWKYLEAAPSDLISSIWGANFDENGDNSTIPPELTGIGYGNTNSQYMYNTYGPNGANTLANYPVFNVCFLSTAGGYNDWFLPSRDELNKMFVNLERGTNDDAGIAIYPPVGDFISSDYWSSSEFAIGNSWYQNFNLGGQAASNKISNLRVRAIRAFK